MNVKFTDVELERLGAFEFLKKRNKSFKMLENEFTGSKST